MVLCHAHAQLDDSFDEEFEVANYNLAQVAEFEAARRHHHHHQNNNMPVPSSAASTSLTQSHVSHLSSDPMQIDSIVSVPAAAASLAPTPSHSRKLKRSCDCDAAYELADASTKRVKQVAF
ncbi:hypothetical protein TWF696_007579 [Orbilia brochopaga]|uniref:Uncharacterized protein n=1 Tax=Orbilia brochopaga TaxID=3140254 RepID=A0AAV9URR6_9PEZI